MFTIISPAKMNEQAAYTPSGVVGGRPYAGFWTSTTESESEAHNFAIANTGQVFTGNLDKEIARCNEPGRWCFSHRDKIG